eukprot:8398-Heterococcus_DN1.PRE.7
MHQQYQYPQIPPYAAVLVVFRNRTLYLQLQPSVTDLHEKRQQRDSASLILLQRTVQLTDIHVSALQCKAIGDTRNVRLGPCTQFCSVIHIAVDDSSA